jgi:hypothetical protein
LVACGLFFFLLPARRRWRIWVAPCDAKANLSFLFGV